MKISVQADIISFAEHIVLALKPMADAKNVELIFSSYEKKITAFFRPAALATELIEIISDLIQLTPSRQKILLSIEMINSAECVIKIKNTGVNSVHNKNIVPKNKVATPVSFKTNETGYQIKLALSSKQIVSAITTENVTKKIPSQILPEFYSEIRKRLHSHFSKADNLVAVLSNHNPKEAVFLKKVNALIISNLDNTQFDANYLSNAMNMCRTQLYRRLKPIIRQSPGSYIKTIKLQKAKELFETTDLRINEVSFKTGFESPSHFTKAFTKLYGVKPSLFCRKKVQQMNE